MRVSCRQVFAGLGCCAALIAQGATAHAQERFNPRLGLITTGFFYRVTTAVRVNPIGLFVDGRAGLRFRLFTSPTRHPILRNTYAALAATVTASPAFVRPGIALEIQPLAMLNLQVVYEPIVQWFGTFGHVQSFNDVNVNYSDAALSRNRDIAANIQKPRGWQLTFQGTLQARIGQSLAIRNTTRAVYASYSLDGFTTGRTGVYYDPFYDVLAPTDGWVIANDLDVITQLSDVGTNIGLRYSVVAPLYPAALGSANVDTTTHRLGPIVTYTFRERRHAWFNAPTVFVLAQWWIQHQWRNGGDSPDAVTQYAPMFIVGFSFRGDA